MSYGRKAVEELLSEGLSAIEASFTMAKAAGPEGEGGDGNDDLDKDFAAFDSARQGSDQADEDKDKGEDDQDEDGGHADGDEDDTDWNGGQGNAPMAKAYQEVDATPLLQALDEKLGEMNRHLTALTSQNAALAAQNATLAKAVQESARGSNAMAKAVAGALGMPLTPKSQQRTAVIPTRPAAPAGMDRNTVMSKAVNAVENGVLSVEHIATFEVLVNQQGLEAALSQMPAVRAAVAKE